MSAHQSEIPVDRLGRLGAAMIATLEAHPEFREGDQAIIMLHDDNVSCTALSGYDDSLQALAELLAHIKGLFEANGKKFSLGFGKTDMDAATVGPRERTVSEVINRGSCPPLAVAA